MRLSSLQFRAGAVWLLIVVAAALGGRWSAEAARERFLQELSDRAARCAVAFQTDDVAALAGTRADLDTAPYTAVKQRLMKLHAVSPKFRFIYLFRSTDEPGRVIFLADSEPAGSSEISLPGDDYPEAPDSPGLQSALRTFQPATEGPLRDSFGQWITAYAPVGELPPPGAPRVILGIDVDASDWQRELWTAGLSTAAYVFLFLSVPLGAFIVLRRERSLTREIRRLSAAIQQSHSAVLITSVDRTIEYANSGCVTITGYQLEELIGQPTRMLLPREASEESRETLLRHLLRGERWQGEMSIRRRNGEIFPARAIFSPVRNRSGQVVNLVAVLDDISEQKRAENELRVARDQAQSADRAKGEFLAVMSHELRTPLNGIIGFATLLQDTPLSPEQSDYAETIRKSGAALLEITNELLDYSRIDAGRMQLDPQACSPRQIVEETVELLSARAGEKHLELLTTISPDVPSYVLADPGRLRQVLVNLVGNAIKFTPSGEVEVDVTCTPAAGDGADRVVQMRFAVRDTGVGIAADQQDRLFQPFSQIDSSSTRRHGGAGLGLAISQSLVRLMGGEIEVTSSPGSGSMFAFVIPVRVIEVAAPLPPLPRRHVAVISANARARAAYRTLLASWNLEVSTSENLAAIAATPKPDIVIVDVLARDAALWPELLRQHPILSTCPVVGLVPVTVPGQLRDELRAAFRAFLKKPLRDTLFHAVLQSIARG